MLDPVSGQNCSHLVLPQSRDFARPSAANRRSQAALGDLLEQRLVADLENARGLGAVPAHAIEHFEERLALGVSRPRRPTSLRPSPRIGGGTEPCPCLRRCAPVKAPSQATKDSWPELPFGTRTGATRSPKARRSRK